VGRKRKYAEQTRRKSVTLPQRLWDKLVAAGDNANDALYNLVEQAEQPRDRQLEQWMRKYLPRNKRTFSRDAVEILLALLWDEVRKS
jgi:hypothetical protein